MNCSISVTYKNTTNNKFYLVEGEKEKIDYNQSPIFSNCRIKCLYFGQKIVSFESVLSQCLLVGVFKEETSEDGLSHEAEM